MALSLFQTSRTWNGAIGTRRNASRESIRNFSRACVGCCCPRQRIAAAISEIWRIPGLHSICKLFYDHDVSDSGASARMDVGLPDCNRIILCAGLAGASPRADADSKSKVNGPSILARLVNLF